MKSYYIHTHLEREWEWASEWVRQTYKNFENVTKWHVLPWFVSWWCLCSPSLFRSLALCLSFAFCMYKYLRLNAFLFLSSILNMLINEFIIKKFLELALHRASGNSPHKHGYWILLIFFSETQFRLCFEFWRAQESRLYCIRSRLEIIVTI